MDFLKRQRQFRGTVGVLLAAAVVVGCAPKNKFQEPPPPEVTVAHPVQQDVTSYLEITGMAHPVLTVEIRARVRGFLKERLVAEGSSVKQGQLLLVIDEEPFRVQLDQAKAKLAEAEAALQKAQQSQSREMAQAQLALDESQLRLAKAEEQRLSKLIATRAVTADEWDRAVATRQKCEAQVQSTLANVKQADADYGTNILSAKANISAASNAVRNAEIELGYCRIASPIDGRIGRVNFDVGNLVGDGQASLLATVMKIDPIYTYTNLSVDNFLKYRNAAGNSTAPSAEQRTIEVELELPYEQGYPHRGHVDYYDPQVDKGTGTIEVRSVFPNSEGTILPGMYARLRVPVSHKQNALLVPDRALSVDQSGQYLLVVGEGDKVEYRQVQVGSQQSGLREVEGKVGPQDRVIVEGLLRARPGSKVVPKFAVQSAPTSKAPLEQQADAGQPPQR
ncbi:MAG: efflux RND transporter periplasmic adaptor subunit [Pirellulales bacterium]|nr:efflux RND transporter periplasmic adaptor subunit [Pirellulales bacterium]